MMANQLREQLADKAHETWARWMKHLFKVCHETEDGSVIIPTALVDRWKRQISTHYTELPESEKESDRREADRTIELLEERN